jgi:hypothetical protein
MRGAVMAMTPEQEADLIEKMHEAYFSREISSGRESMERALSFAKPIIRDEALEDAKAACWPSKDDNWTSDQIVAFATAVARINAIKSKGQKP